MATSCRRVFVLHGGRGVEALLGGLLSRNFGFNTGVQFMGYYTAVMSVPALTKLFGG